MGSLYTSQVCLNYYYVEKENSMMSAFRCWFYNIIVDTNVRFQC